MAEKSRETRMGLTFLYETSDGKQHEVRARTEQAARAKAEQRHGKALTDWHRLPSRKDIRLEEGR